jgi:hypothetical protein
MTTAEDHSPDQKRAARAAAEADRRRRIKAVDDACDRAGIARRYADLDRDQRARAIDETAATLSGDCLAAYVLDGDRPETRPAPEPTPEPAPTSSDEERLKRLVEKGDTAGWTHAEAAEVRHLRAALAPAPAETGAAPRPRRARDPEARTFADRAGAVGASVGVRSGWTPRQARCFLDGTTVVADEHGLVGIRHGDAYHEVSREQLAAFGLRGEKIAAVRAAVVDLTRDTGRALWGRQFAIYCLAALAALDAETPA